MSVRCLCVILCDLTSDLTTCIDVCGPYDTRIAGAFERWMDMAHALKHVRCSLKRAAQRMMIRRLRTSWQGGVTLVHCQLFSSI